MFRPELAVPKESRLPAILTLLIGLAYLIVGGFEVLSSLHLIPPIVGFTDLLGGILLMIISSVFLTGVKPLLKNDQEGYAFVAVGYILAALLFGLQILVILTNALGWFLHFENWVSWNIWTDFTPSLWMFIILMTGTGSVWAIGNMRDKIMGVKKEDSQ
ncbi:MAG: hypothetical protein EAX87_01265 [Candidatus Thorarchaeota archaeon]|nr:hypothetical protein [Candidatus Thorarchaeota archaeon]